MKRGLLRIVVTLSLGLNLIGLLGSLVVVERKGGFEWLSLQIAQAVHPRTASATQPDYPYTTRLSVFEQLPIGPDDIVFLGDSIFVFAEWHEFLHDDHVKNRSINGDDTHTILRRLDPIVEGKPRHIVLHCGINNFQKGVPLTQTTTEYAHIVSIISSKLPTTDVWLLPAFPVNADLFKRFIVPDYPALKMPPATEVEALNAFIKSLAIGKPHVHFVAMPELLGKTGELQESYTFDGIHLNGRGLRAVGERMRTLITIASKRPHEPASGIAHETSPRMTSMISMER